MNPEQETILKAICLSEYENYLDVLAVTFPHNGLPESLAIFEAGFAAGYEQKVFTEVKLKKRKK